MYGFEYDKGYFKALLDFRNFIEQLNDSFYFKSSKKKYKNCIMSALNMLTEDGVVRDEFMKYGDGRVFNGLLILEDGSFSKKK